jgi:hypothetical protein
VKAKEYSCYDINGYHFRTVKLEANHPLVATSNIGVVRSVADATGDITDYYGVLQKIIEYMFGGAKELRVVYFDCDLFDPISNTRVNNFGMVEVKHMSHLSDNNIVLAHQVPHVYYLSYPHQSLKIGGWYIKCLLK